MKQKTLTAGALATLACLSFMRNLLPALIVGRVNTSAGPKQMVIVTGVSDNISALS